MVYNYEIIHRFSKNTKAKVLSSLVLDAFKINVGERERDQERGRW